MPPSRKPHENLFLQSLQVCINIWFILLKQYERNFLMGNVGPPNSNIVASYALLKCQHSELGTSLLPYYFYICFIFSYHFFIKRLYFVTLAHALSTCSSYSVEKFFMLVKVRSTLIKSPMKFTCASAWEHSPRISHSRERASAYIVFYRWGIFQAQKRGRNERFTIQSYRSICKMRS